MPNWADENDRHWYKDVEIPHAPIAVRPGCACAYCAEQLAEEAPSKPPRDLNLEDRTGDRVRFHFQKHAVNRARSPVLDDPPPSPHEEAQLPDQLLLEV